MSNHHTVSETVTFSNLSNKFYWGNYKSITLQKMFYSMYMRWDVRWGDIIGFNAFIGEIICIGTQVTLVAFCWSAETKLDKQQILPVDVWLISCCLTVCSLLLWGKGESLPHRVNLFFFFFSFYHRLTFLCLSVSLTVADRLARLCAILCVFFIIVKVYL